MCNIEACLISRSRLVSSFDVKDIGNPNLIRLAEIQWRKAIKKKAKIKIWIIKPIISSFI